MKTLEERAQLAGDEQFHASYIPKIEKVRGKQFDHEIGEIEVHYTNGFEEGYLAGARAEVEAYKQRVLEAVGELVRELEEDHGRGIEMKRAKKKARELSECCNAPAKFIAATHWPIISGWKCSKCYCACGVKKHVKSR